MNGIIVAAAAEKFTVADAGIAAIFGYIVVFIGLAVLMAILCISGAFFKAKDKKAAEAAAEAAAKAAAETKAEPEETPEIKLAPGSAGRVKLFDVPDKEAAMIMAIVADKMQKPLNELHFISIKEVK